MNVITGQPSRTLHSACVCARESGALRCCRPCRRNPPVELSSLGRREARFLEHPQHVIGELLLLGRKRRRVSPAQDEHERSRGASYSCASTRQRGGATRAPARAATGTRRRRPSLLTTCLIRKSLTNSFAKKPLVLADEHTATLFVPGGLAFPPDNPDVRAKALQAWSSYSELAWGGRLRNWPGWHRKLDGKRGGSGEAAVRGSFGSTRRCTQGGEHGARGSDGVPAWTRLSRE
jgi:hypothetical protein